MGHIAEPLLHRRDVNALRADVADLMARAEALLPRIADAGRTQRVHLQKSLGKLACAYFEAAGNLLRQSHTLHREMLNDPRMLALRRALRPYMGL